MPGVASLQGCIEGESGETARSFGACTDVGNTLKRLAPTSAHTKHKHVSRIYHRSLFTRTHDHCHDHCHDADEGQHDSHDEAPPQPLHQLDECLRSTGSSQRALRLLDGAPRRLQNPIDVHAPQRFSALTSHVFALCTLRRQPRVADGRNRGVRSQQTVS